MYKAGQKPVLLWWMFFTLSCSVETEARYVSVHHQRSQQDLGFVDVVSKTNSHVYTEHYSTKDAKLKFAGASLLSQSKK